MKRHVICLGDSNTHGYCGAQEGETLCGGRFSEAERWPCLLQRALGEEYLVIEEGLCGRTTVFPDPLEPGLDAISYLRPCLLSHAPVSLLILVLGTNDTKERFGLSAEEIARGMERLARQAMSEDCWDPWDPTCWSWRLPPFVRRWSTPPWPLPWPGMRGEVPSAGGALPPAGSQAGRAFPGRGGL